MKTKIPTKQRKLIKERILRELVSTSKKVDSNFFGEISRQLIIEATLSAVKDRYDLTHITLLQVAKQTHTVDECLEKLFLLLNEVYRNKNIHGQ